MTHWWAGKHLHEFIDKTPGEIVRVENCEDKLDEYVVKYYEDPITHPNKHKDNYWLKNFTVRKGFNEIEVWIDRFATEEDIEDYQTKLDTKKYNL